MLNKTDPLWASCQVRPAFIASHFPCNCIFRKCKAPVSLLSVDFFVIAAWFRPAQWAMNPKQSFVLSSFLAIASRRFRFLFLFKMNSFFFVYHD